MKTLPISVQHSVAEFYHRDARDFASRFDVLWEDQLHKTGRIKSFVDLVMGCECALKSHVFLSRLDEDPDETYKLVRRAGHNSERLSILAKFLADRSLYEQVGSKLAPFSVIVRYSLDAYSTFFPVLSDWSDAPINHAATVGNNTWVLSVRHDLEQLIDSASTEFTGRVNNDIEAILQNGQELEAFMRRNAPNNLFKPNPLRGSA
ncbi:hypothetical protein [Xanthomonas translucens]|uniref:hypothetical protein n=1 Tax=Xanthomonas campestris pv. translucens TaxID=343 RepID=UPI0010081A20|nr:hypothetical protein [Xanthomonas translucens]MCT8276525.1 hypothetical protein [Xanthomonas translucens pv. translucens]MCT8280308.1 hypothetical protein [Xanthomonas translucens pv. translucens]MCT8309237.1 hypothetical protein [Xanthomonas translucens pv. translucens]MQS40207.1 hypothetical protein [Xanthomonas translucens pv. translucens]QSQ37928.1 hypothetical protein ISN32_19800 [Xanthomonas translucens pv. translucens]